MTKNTFTGKKFSSAIILITLLLLPSLVHGINQAAALFLLVSPSPRANGMGNTYTHLMWDDPMAVWFNPAAVGMQAKDHYFSGGFYTSKTNWLRGLVTGMTYNFQSYNFGYNFEEKVMATSSNQRDGKSSYWESSHSVLDAMKISMAEYATRPADTDSIFPDFFTPFDGSILK